MVLLGLLGAGSIGPSSAAPPNDTIVVSLAADVESLDLATSWRRIVEFVISPAYETLVDWIPVPGGGRTYRPAIARSWRMAEDGLSWIVELEPGHYFADGNELTADSVKFTFERILGMKRGPAASIEYIKAVEVLDDYRVRFRLHNRHVQFLPNLSVAIVGLINPRIRRHEVNGDYASQWLSTHTAGSGPYQLTIYEMGNRYILETNPRYHGKIGPIKRIVFEINKDDAIRTLRLAKGDVDFAPDISVDSLEGLKQHPRLNIHSGPSYSIYYLALNNESGVMSNLYARRAVQRAIDYQSISEIVFRGHAVPYPGQLPAGMTGADPSLYSLDFDLDQARRLLRQGGVKPGANFMLVYQDRGTPMVETMALMLQADLNAIGFDVQLVRLSQVAAIDRAARGNYDALFGGWYTATDDPGEIINFWLNPKHVGSGLNPARYANARVGELLEQSVVLFDVEERARVIREALALAAADALVWDNQACLSIEITDEFFPSLKRHNACGVDIVGLNVGYDGKPWEHAALMTAHLRHWFLARPDDYVMVSSVADIRRAKREDKMAISFNIEGMAAVEPHIGLVRMFYDLGLRWMAIAYNLNNKCGGGCHDEDCGLTDYWRQVLDEMAEVGMVTCCSHTGYRTAMEVFEYCENPVIFSHSNPRSLCDHPRNVPDELMKACAKSGGVQGITGSNRFLGDDDARPETFLRHLDYAVQLIGPEHVGISSGYTFEADFMKIDITEMSNRWPKGFGYEGGICFVEPEQLPELTEGMLRMGYSDEVIRGILGENFLRVAEQVWK